MCSSRRSCSERNLISSRLSEMYSMGSVKLLQNGERRHGLGSRVPGNVQNARSIKSALFGGAT